ncbi:MAG: DUF424 family protein [Halobacteriota archaeon]
MYSRKEIYVKKHRSGLTLLVAVCDVELVGKSFAEGELNLKITESFYKGEAVTEEEVVASLEQATIANLVGERAIRCALANSFIEEANIISVAGVPHAQMVKL